MTFDPIVVTAVIAAISALGLLLIGIVRLFLTGSIMPRSVVPREDYEALQEVIASLIPAMATLTGGVKKIGVSVELIRKLVSANGAKR